MPRVAPVRRSPVFVALAAVWIAVQLALPLRHLGYSGDHRWTGQGYRFAWNVLLVEKSGSVTFLVREPSSGRRWVADPTELYTRNQLRVMATEPDLIHQAAIAIAADERTRGHDVEVRVDAWVSLNARPAARLIDPTVDLARRTPRPLVRRLDPPRPGVIGAGRKPGHLVQSSGGGSTDLGCATEVRGDLGLWYSRSAVDA